MAKGIKKFVSELNRLNEGNYQFVVVEQYSNTFSIVGAHKGDQVTFNYPGGFKWDGYKSQYQNYQKRENKIYQFR